MPQQVAPMTQLQSQMQQKEQAAIAPAPDAPSANGYRPGSPQDPAYNRCKFTPQVCMCGDQPPPAAPAASAAAPAAASSAAPAASSAAPATSGAPAASTSAAAP